MRRENEISEAVKDAINGEVGCLANTLIAIMVAAAFFAGFASKKTDTRLKNLESRVGQLEAKEK